MTSQLRSLLITTIVLLAAPIFGCGQEASRKMVSGASAKELVPESPSEKEDGVSQIVIGQLFKPGTTEYAFIGAKGVKDAPPLPSGYVLYKDLAFRVKSEAITSGYQLIVFDVPSAANEAEFDRLDILHLEADEMSPSGFSWSPVTVVRDGWDDHYHFVSKNQYEARLPDFKSKRITAITHEFGVFAVALTPEFESQSRGSFTKFEITTSSSPDPVPVGDEVTHTFIVKNKGPSAAAEVDFKAELDADFGYTASSSQGSCHQSDASSGRTLCYLGAMPPGSTTTITVTGRVSHHLVLNDGINVRGNMLEVVFKANPTDLVGVDSQVFMQFDFKILKKP